MITSNDLVKAFLNEFYPEYIYTSHDEYDNAIDKNTFTITFINPNVKIGNGISNMEVSVIEFITFVFNKMNKPDVKREIRKPKNKDFKSLKIGDEVTYIGSVIHPKSKYLTIDKQYEIVKFWYDRNDEWFCCFVRQDNGKLKQIREGSRVFVIPIKKEK